MHTNEPRSTRSFLGLSSTTIVNCFVNQNKLADSLLVADQFFFHLLSSRWENANKVVSSVWQFKQKISARINRKRNIRPRIRERERMWQNKAFLISWIHAVCLSNTHSYRLTCEPPWNGNHGLPLSIAQSQWIRYLL